MHRRPLVIGIVLVGLSTLALEACGSRHCGFDLCSNGASVTAHVETTRSALLQATTTVCWNERCSTVTPRSLDADASVGEDDGQFTLGPPLMGDGSIFDEGGGWARLELAPFQKPASEIADGDHYRVTIVAPDGHSLLDVDRFVRYSIFGSAECGPTCKQSAISLYPDSEPGLSCTGNTCRSQQQGVSFHRVITVGTARHYGNTVLACFNAKCSTPASIQYVGNGATATLEGNVTGIARFAEIEDGKKIDFRLDLALPSPVLADGDRYRVEIRSPSSGESLLVFDDSVTYETEFPNGPACDRYPCRGLHLEIP